MEFIARRLASLAKMQICAHALTLVLGDGRKVQLQSRMTPLDIHECGVVGFPDALLAEPVHALRALCGHLLALRILEVGPRKFHRLHIMSG